MPRAETINDTEEWKCNMHPWSVQDEKARFDELLNACIEEGPQMLTWCGTETAALVPVSEWGRLQAAGRLTLRALLLSDDVRAELTVPPPWPGPTSAHQLVGLTRMYLPDTKVVSELRRPRSHGTVLARLLRGETS